MCVTMPMVIVVLVIAAAESCWLYKAVLLFLALVLDLEMSSESLAWVLDLEMSSETNFESLAFALRVKSLVNSPVHLRATQTMTWRQLRLLATVSFDSFEPLTLFNKVFIAWTCATVELLFLIVLCSLAPRNLKLSLNVFWRQVIGLEAQVLVNNTGIKPLITICISAVYVNLMVGDWLADCWQPSMLENSAVMSRWKDCDFIPTYS